MKTAEMLAPSPDSSQVLPSLSSQQEADTDSVPTDADAAELSYLDTGSHTKNGLPAPFPLASPAFSWGEYEASTFAQTLEEAYDEVVHWRRNLFQIPFGNAGKSFVLELSRLFRAYAEGSALESTAMKACTVMLQLLMQKLFQSSKDKTMLPNYFDVLRYERKLTCLHYYQRDKSSNFASLNNSIDPVRSSKKRQHNLHTANVSGQNYCSN